MSCRLLRYICQLFSSKIFTLVAVVFLGCIAMKDNVYTIVCEGEVVNSSSIGVDMVVTIREILASSGVATSSLEVVLVREQLGGKKDEEKMEICRRLNGRIQRQIILTKAVSSTDRWRAGWKAPAPARSSSCFEPEQGETDGATSHKLDLDSFQSVTVWPVNVNRSHCGLPDQEDLIRRWTSTLATGWNAVGIRGCKCVMET